VLVGATIVFAYADSLPLLFAARLLQGAADAVTWVVGFALIADLYGAPDRGRVMGLVMAGSNFGFMIGPTLGGWLYEAGGMQLPFLVVAALGAMAALGLAWMRIPDSRPVTVERGITTIAALRAPQVRACAIAVVAAGGTIAMAEPVLSLFLSYEIGLQPFRIGLVFGAASIVATLLHPIFGGLADRRGARRVTVIGLVAFAFTLPLMSLTRSFETATLFYVVQGVSIAVVIAPSLAYMAEAIASTGLESFGVAYGVYNFSWALGLLLGPALGGFLYERLGFAMLTVLWAPLLLVAGIILARTRIASTTIQES
jgi:MFS family permease